MAQTPETARPETPALDRRDLALRGAVALAVALPIGFLVITGSAPSGAEMREWGEDLDGPAVAAWPLAFAALTLLLPWPLVAGATGAVFGTALGTPLSLVGVCICAAIQFGLARHLAGERLRAQVLARVPRIDAALDRNDLLAIFYSRIVPGVPWGVVNYAAGLARVRLAALLLATATAGLPKVFAYTALGGSLDNLGTPEARIAIAVMVVMALAGVFVARRRLPRLRAGH